ncbi:hypothetical protein MJD09_24395 [bacterium]|nr:hypothetical protein [bacterium]
MQTRRTSLSTSMIFLVALLTYLQAQDKKPTPESLQNGSGEVFVLHRAAQTDAGLITKLQTSPDPKVLSAADKVRLITKELRKNRTVPRANRNAIKRERLESVSNQRSNGLKLKQKQD